MPISRKMLDGHDAIWEDAEPFDVRSAWLDLLFFARFAPGVSEGERLERGELLASVRFLAERWRWGRGTVHDYLKRLENLGRIAERRAGHRGTVYMVVNYDTYNPAEGKPRTPKRTPRRTTSGRHPDKDKEGKEGKDTTLVELVAEGAAIWKAEMGGDMNFGRLRKAWRGLLRDREPAAILDAWRNYFLKNQRAEDRRYCSPEHFASRVGLYAAPVIRELTDDYGRMIPHRQNETGEWVPLVSVA